MKLTYKKGFWILLVISLLLAIYQFGLKTSLEVELAFKKMEVSFLKSEASIIGEIATNGLNSKNEIKSFLSKNHPSDGMVIKGDTLFLDNSYMLFKKDSLVSITID